MNEISRNPAHTVTELANARQHQNGGLLAWLLVRTIVLVRIINDLVPIVAEPKKRFSKTFFFFFDSARFFGSATLYYTTIPAAMMMMN